MKPRFGRQQWLDGWSKAIDDKPKISRVAWGRALKFFERRLNCSTSGMTENDDQLCSEPFGRELNTAKLGRGHNISGNANHE